jgi:hypothetical protein
MLRLSKSTLAVALLIVVSLFLFATPRTVHAVAAALVQITNTASNPVVTQSVGQQAAQLIHLQCGFNENGACTLFGISFSPSEQYLIPANQSLVITAVDIMPVQIYYSPQCNLNHIHVLNASNSTAGVFAQTWIVGSQSLHFTYPSGITFSSGVTITSRTNYYNVPSSCFSATPSDQMDLYGYLIAD